MPSQISLEVATTNIIHMLNQSTSSFQTSMDRLSSGSKINKTSDNPINASKSVKIGSEVNLNKYASSNISIGSQMLGIANGQQSNALESLQSIKELCLQALNGTYSDSDKTAILNDIRSELSAIDSIADNTSFNGQNLLDGSNTDMTLQTGVSSSASLKVGDSLIDIHTSQLGSDIRIASNITGETWSDISGYMEKIDEAINQVTQVATLSAGYQERLENTFANLQTSTTNLMSGKSALTDADIAAESADLVKYQILQQSSATILTQANQSASLALSLLQI